MTTLVSSIWPGIARAVRDDRGLWSVDRYLPDVHVTALAAGPRGSDRLWAGSRGGAVYRSDDGGSTWKQSAAEGGLGGFGIRSLASSPHDASVIYAGAKPASVWRSDDGGLSWQRCAGFDRSRRWWWASPAEPPDWTPYVSGLAVSPSDPGVVLAGIEAGAVLRSDDAGATWSDHRRRADRDCHALCFHPHDGAWVYEAGGGGPAVSHDGGLTWRHAAGGLDGRYSMACAADPLRPEVWYVSASPLAVWPRFWRIPVAHVDGEAHAAIYRSSGGAGWERLSGGLPQPLDHMAYGLATDVAEPGRVYAGLADGSVWSSRDHGDTWGRLPFTMGGVRRAFLVA